MRKISEQLFSLCSEFMVNELKERVLDGVTYAFIGRDKKSEKLYNKYNNIRMKATSEGIEPDEVLKCFSTNEWYIFDLNKDIAVMAMTNLLKEIDLGTTAPSFDIKSKFEYSKDREMKRIAKQAKDKISAGKSSFEAVMFSRTSISKVTFTGRTADNIAVGVSYPNFRLTHEDIKKVNDKYLIDIGMRISYIKICEITPSMSGMRVILGVEKLGEIR